MIIDWLFAHQTVSIFIVMAAVFVVGLLVPQDHAAVPYLDCEPVYSGIDLASFGVPSDVDQMIASYDPLAEEFRKLEDQVAERDARFAMALQDERERDMIRRGVPDGTTSRYLPASITPWHHG